MYENLDLDKAYETGFINADELFDQDPELLEAPLDTRALSFGEKITARDIEATKPRNERYMSLEEEKFYLSTVYEGNHAAIQLKQVNLTSDERSIYETAVMDAEDAKLILFIDNVRFIAHFVRSTMDFYKQTDEHPNRKTTPVDAKITHRLGDLAGGSLTYGDRISIATIGFFNAPDNHDPAKYTGSFRTFATWHMESKLLREIRDTSSTINIPKDRMDLARKYTALSINNEPLPWVDLELAEVLKAKVASQRIALETLDDYLQGEQVDGYEGCADLDVLNLSDVLVEEAIEASVADQGIDYSLGLQIDTVLAQLDERQQFVIERRFFDGLTLEEIGEAISVTRERVRQIEAKSLARLRQPMRSEGLRAEIGFSSEDPQFGQRSTLRISEADDMALGLIREPAHNHKSVKDYHSNSRRTYTLSDYNDMRAS